LNTVSNSIPQSLNYLIFLYHSHHHFIYNESRFPVLSQNHFIDFDLFCSRLSHIWNEIMRHAEQEDDFVRWDLAYFQNGSGFRDLFVPGESGEHFFQETKKSFSAWWWPQPYGGQFLLDQLSSPMVSPIYQGLRQLSEARNIDFPDVILFAVYDRIPPSCMPKNSRCFVYPVGRPEQNIAAVETIVHALFSSFPS